jgi:uncharacterized protein (DUF1800 family)
MLLFATIQPRSLRPLSTKGALDRWEQASGSRRMSNDAVIAANRFGLGARGGEIKTLACDPRGWLTQQVEGSRPVPPEVVSLPSSVDVLAIYTQVRKDQRDAHRQPASEATVTQRALATFRQRVSQLHLEQVSARYAIATRTTEPFRERLVHFWTNHFAVSVDKPQVIGLAGPLENEAIRPHVAGRFVDMLLAAEAHPAMIFYLDNQASIGPRSDLGMRAMARPREPARKLDINENLAREILELHTLGVHGGYTQADVIAFARALTGWSIGGHGRLSRDDDAETFEFRRVMHEPGPKTVLGKHYAEDGIAQPRAMLEDFARHPATASHLATKLVRHFVADDPPADAVERVARAFRDSDGDLPTVHRALVSVSQAWKKPATELKTPHDFVVSTFRMFDSLPAEPRQVAGPFEVLGQRPYAPGSPAGWPDTADRWDAPDALLQRIEWAASVGKRVGGSAHPVELGERSLGASFAPRTRTAVAHAISAAQGITLLLSSPEFQRR